MSYAEGTQVPVARSRAEIEQLVSKYGAAEFSSGWINGQAAVQFLAHGRRVRFTIELPTASAAPKKVARTWGYKSGVVRAQEWAEQEMRRRWRALLLAIKAKLEAVQTGITAFDEEFLAHIVVDDMTVYERLTTGANRLLPPIAENEKR